MLFILPRLCRQHLRSYVQSHIRQLTTGQPNVCIVGAGPAGFYTAQQILKGNPNAVVDIYEKLPVPFGLVRYGVAPDHPEVKNVINTFTQTASKDRCTFIGNVTIGKDISIADLQKAYSAVVLSYGADNDRLLGVPGENLKNVISARSFVGWYNGLPQDIDLQVNLDVEKAVIIGHGNVALDVARILLMPIDLLKKTDISQYSLDALSKSRIKEVTVIGRRGPLQVAFTIKELREMIRLPDCKPVLSQADFLGVDKLIQDLPRPRRRLTELMYKTCMEPTEKDLKLWETAQKSWSLSFCMSPLEIFGDKDVTGLKLGINKLQGEDLVKQSAILTDQTIDMSCGLVLRSIGYKSILIDPDIPFDTKSGTIPNKESRVEGKPGMYCTGWVSTGPVGVILTTMNQAFETGKTVVKDINDGILDLTKPGKRDILNILNSKGVQTVSFKDWENIDQFEVKQGEDIGKPREKMVDISQMVSVAKKS
ncbi:NADPH:adrenodoxin oxidoreductase, mitochondrial-like [Mytilus trossulus]|uniref:NADPH:adrenodoxin oxidoreductase, mitochondrial-like n=1 Tax=Mytilus trossulus TaxID=6551 RepID=UPI003004EF64